MYRTTVSAVKKKWMISEGAVTEIISFDERLKKNDTVKEWVKIVINNQKKVTVVRVVTKKKKKKE